MRGIKREGVDEVFKYDTSISRQVHPAGTPKNFKVRKYDLEKLDIRAFTVLSVGVAADAELRKAGFEYSEDYADLFDSVGILLRWVGQNMLRQVYKNDPTEDQINWIQITTDEDFHLCLETIEQFGFIGLLKKRS